MFGIKPSTMLVILAAIGIIVIATAPLSISGWNTDGEIGQARKWDWKVEFTETEYVVSWKSDVSSETITATGYYLKDFGSVATLEEYRYTVKINGVVNDGLSTDWTDLPATVISSGTWYPLPPHTFNIKGNVPGKLTVTLDVKIQDWDVAWAGLHVYEGDAWDGAYLKSGKGECYLLGNQGPFEVGGTATVAIETGYSPDGWTAKLYPPYDRTDLPNPIEVKTFDNDVRTTWKITIQDGWFKAGSSNEFRVELWNDYFNDGFTQIFAVDQLDRIPKITSINVTNNGDSMTYAVTAERTYADLDNITVWAWYGYGGTTMPPQEDTESWVLYGTGFPFSGNTVTFTIQPKNMDGTIVVKVVAYDVDGRTSEPEYSSVVVVDGRTDAGGDPLGGQFLWSMPVIGMVAAAIIIPALIIGFLPGDPIRSLAMAGAVAGLLLFVAYLLGTGTIALTAGSEAVFSQIFRGW